MAVSVLVVYPHEHLADWELRLAAALQHHPDSIILLITNLRKDQSSKSEFPLNVNCFCTTLSQGPSVVPCIRFHNVYHNYN